MGNIVIGKYATTEIMNITALMILTFCLLTFYFRLSEKETISSQINF